MRCFTITIIQVITAFIMYVHLITDVESTDPLDVLQKLIAKCPPYIVIFETEDQCVNIDKAAHRAVSGGAPGGDMGAIAGNLVQAGRKGCELKICGDGKKLVGTYCGEDSCNIIGWNCDCIEGSRSDAVQRFLNRWPPGKIFKAEIWDQ